jgi:hypothetical protein
VTPYDPLTGKQERVAYGVDPPRGSLWRLACPLAGFAPNLFVGSAEAKKALAVPYPDSYRNCCSCSESEKFSVDTLPVGMAITRLPKVFSSKSSSAFMAVSITSLTMSSGHRSPSIGLLGGFPSRGATVKPERPGWMVGPWLVEQEHR